jgi:hypothetical protein
MRNVNDGVELSQPDSPSLGGGMSKRNASENGCLRPPFKFHRGSRLLGNGIALLAIIPPPRRAFLLSIFIQCAVLCFVGGDTHD